MGSQRERSKSKARDEHASGSTRSETNAAPESRPQLGNLDVQRSLHGGAIGDRGDFMARLHEMSSATATEMLGDRARDCPYIEAWFERHADTDPETLERMARRYGGVAGATTPEQLMEALRARLRAGIASWNSGKNIGSELALVGLHDSARALAAEDGIAGAIAGDEAQARRVAAELGDGAPLASSSLGGGSATAARVHTDATAARLAHKADARAFTIGRDIVLAAEAPRPGTLAGDALLAHELAHVQQQAVGGGSGLAASEHDADIAGASVVAGRIGMPVPAGRRIAGTRLSLQRCKPKQDPDKDVAKDAGVITGDASVADAATPDAATLPPGKRSWVAALPPPVLKKVGAVTGKDFVSLEDAAAQFGGNTAAIVILLDQYNKAKNAKKKDWANSIGPGTKFDLPTSIDIPGKAEMLPDDVDDPSSVAYWTWKVEEDPHGASASWTPSVPTKESGVTLGRGYDMKERSGDQIEHQLTAAKIDAALATKYRGASGLFGPNAKKWITANQPFDPITAAQEKLLFRQEYAATTDAAVAEVLAKPGLDKKGEYKAAGSDLKLDIDFDHLNPVILAFVVDLRFRCDLNKAWPYIKEAVEANDLAKLQMLVADIGRHKHYFYDNYIRYSARCNLVGITPATEKKFDAAKATK